MPLQAGCADAHQQQSADDEAGAQGSPAARVMQGRALAYRRRQGVGRHRQGEQDDGGDGYGQLLSWLARRG
ncbi:MAG: hypothetical protein IT492_07575 [Gammaproteobacteria bacterium]|nr:hypothetical protein [Gammaproteobacteria bacterium]